MKGEQQFCECGEGLLIIKIVEDRNMIGIKCIKCNKEFYLMTCQKQEVKRVKLNDVNHASSVGDGK